VIPASLLLALPIAVPLAVATAVLVIVGGMAKAGEFQALSSAGIDPVRVILRLWPAVAAMALLVALLAHVAMPLAIRDLRANKGRMLQAAIAERVASLNPIYDMDGTSAWADRVQGRELSDVYIRRISPEGEFSAYAPRASWGLTDAGMQFQLEDLRIIETRADGTLVTGEAAHYVIRPPNSDGVLQTEPDAMLTPAVINELRTAPREGKGCDRFNNARLALHLRFYLPLALFAYALFAAGLALATGVSEGLAAVAVVVVVVALAAYPAIGFVKSNPDARQMDPGILLWGPGLALGALGWWMLKHPIAARELLGRPAGLLAGWVRSVRAMLVGLLRKVRR
jgi:lipopolysaccharide export LptBFGC system permease protein LptF